MNLLEPTQIIYSKRRTLSIVIKGNGDLIVRSPNKVSLDSINKFLNQKESWIQKHRIAKLSTIKEVNKFVVSENNLVKILGIEYILKSDKSVTKAFLLDDSNCILWYNPELENLNRRFYTWLFKYAKHKFVEEVGELSVLMNLKPNQIKLSGAKGRWGSCSSRNHINLNWRLIFSPKEVMRYVVIHEVAHIKHKNHSSKFWDLVAQFEPDYKSHRKWLKQNGHFLIASFDPT